MSARMTECDILITNNNKYENKQKTRPDSKHDSLALACTSEILIPGY